MLRPSDAPGDAAEAEYYRRHLEQLRSTGRTAAVEVRRTARSGKGLYATADVPAGGLLLEEPPLLCSRTLGPGRRRVRNGTAAPCCAATLRPLEPAGAAGRELLRRAGSCDACGVRLETPEEAPWERWHCTLCRRNWGRSDELVACPTQRRCQTGVCSDCRPPEAEGADPTEGLPPFKGRAPAGVPCRAACGAHFASPDVERAAWESWHALLCEGALDGAQREALRAFRRTAWAARGVDYSDTFDFAARVIAAVLSQRRRGRSWEEAWTPYSGMASCSWEDYANDNAEGPSPPPGVPLELAAGLLAAATAADEQEQKQLLSPERIGRVLALLLLNQAVVNPDPPWPRYLHWAKSCANRRDRVVARSIAWGGFSKLSPTGTAIWVTGLTCTNHSCAPTAEPFFGDDATLLLRATVDIACGEEVTCAYICPDAPLDARREYLRRRYRFLCACPRCCAEDRTLGGCYPGRLYRAQSRCPYPASLYAPY